MGHCLVGCRILTLFFFFSTKITLIFTLFLRPLYHFLLKCMLVKTYLSKKDSFIDERNSFIHFKVTSEYLRCQNLKY